MTDVKPQDTIWLARVALAILDFFKTFGIAFMSFSLQDAKAKQKRTEDELELMKADKRSDEEKAKIDASKATDPRRGIDDFLAK
jgi:hypothetical protein